MLNNFKNRPQSWSIEKSILTFIKNINEILYKESLLDMHTNCSCNYVPHLYEYVDMCDIASLIAPRPLLVETGTRDSLNGASGLTNVRAQMRTVRKAYRLLNAQRMISHDVFEGEHLWHGVKAIPWMKKHLDSKKRQ